jgi:uncharacterized protein (TIGR03083 family)
MDSDRTWHHIHAERATLAEHLAELTEAQWQGPTLCAGWTVHDVAAHVISNPQIGWRQLPAMVGRNLGRGYNQMIFREVKRLGATRSREQVMADFAAYADSRHHVPVTTVVEPMVDSLVHAQDVYRPLGIRHDPDPEAAAVAAERCRLLAGLMGSRRTLRAVRMVATDVDWARGTGPVVAAPMAELLMLCGGRAADRTRVTGDGAELVRLA